MYPGFQGPATPRFNYLLIYFDSGKRIVGVCGFKGLSNLQIVQKDSFLWFVPDDWTLEEASTVPVVYCRSQDNYPGLNNILYTHFFRYDFL